MLPNSSLADRSRTVVLTALAVVLSALAFVPPAQAYGPQCPYCTNEPAVLTSADPMMNVSVKWCGISEAPSVNNPGLACQTDFRTMLWRRHERASDCVWIPQGRLTLRSGGAIQLADYVQFNDLSLSPGVPGDVETVNPFTQLIAAFQECDNQWSAQPKGMIAVSANRLVNAAGVSINRGIAVLGSITMPWMMVADPDVFCQLNERSLAHEAGHVLNLGHVTTTGNLMQTGGTGATLTLAQINAARTYLTGNTILDPPGDEAPPYPDLVDFVFDPNNDGDKHARHLDIMKVVSFDNTPNGGDFSLHIGMSGVFPERRRAHIGTYAIGLDADNSQKTGGRVQRGNPVALEIDGVEYLVQIDVARGDSELSAKPTILRYDPLSGTYRDITALLAPYITTRAHVVNMVLCDPDSGSDEDHTHDTFPFASEINLYIANEGLSAAGLKIGPKGLFENGLRLQAGGIDETVSKVDLAPDKPGTLKFPPIEFPTMTLPPRATRGEEIRVTVAGFPEDVPLGVYFGPDYIDPATRTNRQGGAEFTIRVPEKSQAGMTLVSVGIRLPNNAITADSSIEIIVSSAP